MSEKSTIYEIKEFDKIYIAKYKDILTIRQLAEDLRTSQKQINEAIIDLEKKGIYEIYRDIPDREWETLENKTDKYILKRYMNLSEKSNNKAFKEIIEVFSKMNINKTIREFPIFELSKETFYFNYFFEKDFEGEEWQRIKNLNYQISNYGRIKNIVTKKLKQLKFNKYGMQVILWNNSKSYTITISRLVAHYFIREVDSNERVRHKDSNIRNNYYENLEIVSK